MITKVKAKTKAKAKVSKETSKQKDHKWLSEYIAEEKLKLKLWYQFRPTCCPVSKYLLGVAVFIIIILVGILLV